MRRDAARGSGKAGAMAKSGEPGGAAAGVGDIAPQAQVRILAEALPHLIRYDEQTVVIKFGGNAMGDESARRRFRQGYRLPEAVRRQSDRRPRRRPADRGHAEEARDQIRLRARPARHRQADGRESSRWCSPAPSTRRSSRAINRQGGKAVGICGKDANLMIAKKITEMPDPQSNIMQAVDIGYVGDPVEVNPAHRRRHLQVGPHSGRSRRSACRARARRSTSTPTPSPARWPRA